MILAPIIIIGIGAAIGYYVSQSEEEPLPIAVITENEQIQAMVASEEFGLTVNENVETEEEAQQAIQEEEIEGYEIIQVQDNSVEAEYVSAGDSGPGNADILRGLLTNYQSQLKGAELGLSPQEVMELSE